MTASVLFGVGGNQLCMGLAKHLVPEVHDVVADCFFRSRRVRLFKFFQDEKMVL
jgi:hypothetical protein